MGIGLPLFYDPLPIFTVDTYLAVKFQSLTLLEFRILGFLVTYIAESRVHFPVDHLLYLHL